jgi:hypothetical protein
MRECMHVPDCMQNSTKVRCSLVQSYCAVDIVDLVVMPVPQGLQLLMLSLIARY